MSYISGQKILTEEEQTAQAIERVRHWKAFTPSIDDVCRSLGFGYHDYDTALPQQWVDDVHVRTGFWPQEHGFVWSYRDPGAEKTYFGHPYPLTDAAKILLDFYERENERFQETRDQ
jgi:hypothetical protein